MSLTVQSAFAYCHLILMLSLAPKLVSASRADIVLYKGGAVLHIMFLDNTMSLYLIP